MTVQEALGKVKTIRIPGSGFPVEETVAEGLIPYVGDDVRIRRLETKSGYCPPATLQIRVADDRVRKQIRAKGIRLPEQKEWIYFDIAEDGTGLMTSSTPHFLYTLLSWITEELLGKQLAESRNWYREAAFRRNHSRFDVLLTQYARTQKDFNRESYIREYARLGFTHIEVNGLATPFPHEQGVPDEYYPDFYTYCPALDQFVESRLNRGTYPAEYLQANLNFLKANAALALKYGLTPGLLCFEPRSVPDSLLQKYPMLRGPRVDHPFRSFKPRFSLTTVHPAVQRHYSELIYNLLREVPELDYLAVWSNDSGSGFEHTKSLYVGRNGGAFLIREWKDDAEIARSAAGNIANYFRVLKASARRINPDFRVITRLESFYGEREFLWPELKEGVDAEVNSLLVSGWENNYAHPRYPDIQVLNSALHQSLRPEEGRAMRELQGRGSEAFFYHFLSSHANHEPLLGIPFPFLVHEKLRAFTGIGAEALAHMGGIQPPDQVPYPVNQDLFRLFQMDPELDLTITLKALAGRYTGGARDAKSLVRCWKLIDQAVRHFVPLPLYSGFGLIWLRLWARPLVPDIEQIPETERAYYERFICSAPHNPNRVDLAKDILFELIPTDFAGLALNRIDRNVWPFLNRAIDLLETKMRQAGKERNQRPYIVFRDLWFRTLALKCLYETLRNTVAWVWGVHTYIDARTAEKKTKARKVLREMVKREIANCRDFLDLWENSPVEFMMISGIGETTFIHGENLPQLVRRKMDLMKKYGNALPRIDAGFMWRVPGSPHES